MNYYPYYQPQQTPQNAFYGGQQQGANIYPTNPQTPQNGSYIQPNGIISPFLQPQMNTAGIQTQGSAIEYVNGIEGAKAYIMQPNSTKWLMDSDGSYFYLKSSNAQNQANVRMFEYKEIDMSTKKAKEVATSNEIDMSEYVKKEDFDALKKTVASLKKSKTVKLGDSEDE